MKVGFHVYLMPWFAELCLNVGVMRTSMLKTDVATRLLPRCAHQSEQETNPFSVSPLRHLHLSFKMMTSHDVLQDSKWWESEGAVPCQ